MSPARIFAGCPPCAVTFPATICSPLLESDGTVGLTAHELVMAVEDDVRSHLFGLRLQHCVEVPGDARIAESEIGRVQQKQSTRFQTAREIADDGLEALEVDVGIRAPGTRGRQVTEAEYGQAENGNGHSLLLPSPEENSTEIRTSSVGFSRNNPFPARLLTNRKLNGEGSGKETRHFEISLEGSGLNYDAGDALGIYPGNCPALVDDILNALGCDGEEAVPAPAGGEISLRMALTTNFDITKPAAELLHRLTKDNAPLRELLAPDRKDDLREWLWGREVIDLLVETKGASFSPVEFVGLLKPLAPRLYSISSSPKAHTGQVHLTVSIVRHESHGRARKGVCSTFLADRAGEITPVPVFFQPSHGFRLPANGDTPVIMVGPGTGIAPFRAFLHERRATGAKGRNWLFFGEQRAATDFYYREEFELMLADCHLTKLATAFSRDQAEKIYVQHRMIEHAAELWAWLQDGAHLYVCGDVSRMAKDVDAALHTVMETAGGLDREGAAEAVKQLKSAKRYQRDVY